MRTVHITILFILAAGSLAWGAGVVEDWVDRGLSFLQLAATGDDEALASAIDNLERAVAAAPHDAYARALLGSALVWRARTVPLPAKRAQAARGFRELDAAVAMAPLNPEVRLVRAANGYPLPRILGRHEIVAEDFAWLLHWVDSSAQAGDSPLVRRVLHHAGAFALKERRPEAAALFERALATSGDEPSDAVLQSMLELAQAGFSPQQHAKVEEQKSTASPRP